ADRLARTHAEQIVEQIQKLFARKDRLEIAL
ncbi:GntR family transcriptional regulator, partial [Sinorhizobium medicae]